MEKTTALRGQGLPETPNLPPPAGPCLRRVPNTCIASPDSLVGEAHTYHEHAEVRQMASHAKNSGLKVLLVASQVNEGDHFRGLLTDLCPFKAATMAVRLVHYIAFTVKAQNVIAHTAGSTRFNFMFVAKEFLAGKATAIVQLPVC